MNTRSKVRALQVVTLSVAIFGSATAWAQFENDMERYEPDVVVGGVTAVGSERLYVVQPGDTLWDLSGAFFFDPMMWPTLWSLNPQVTNPHWIYPGDVLFIRPQTSLSGGSTLMWSDSRYSQAPRNLSIHTRTKGFIAMEDYQESGIVQYAREPKEMLATYDEVYIDFTAAKSVRAGDLYTIYRVERDVPRPDGDGNVGKLVKFLGIVRVLDTSKPLVRGVVLHAYEEIYRDDLVTGIFEHQKITNPVSNSVDLEGVILAAYEDTNELAEHAYVFIDKGREHGVLPGNRFVLRERGDPYFQQHRTKSLDRDLEDFPWEQIGEMMVVESFDNHCVAIMTASIHEVAVGHSVLMFRGY
ncbi:MAG: LysM peptidoglycan-binding domain-containing protein [Myxococcales bacterium]|nr:LysM peptidoglycan-binding domain-containing protein [Myxococcales bacterium]